LYSFAKGDLVTVQSWMWLKMPQTLNHSTKYGMLHSWMKQMEEYLVCSKYNMGDMNAHTQLQDDCYKYTINHILDAFKNVKVFKNNLKSNKMRARHKFKLSFSFIFLTCCAIFKISTFTNINLFGAIWTSKSCSSNFF
jgi:hypothetical protein